MNKNKNLKGFTLIELLVVIAIIAILAVVVVLTLNPAQLLAQSRDSNRVSDVATLKSAIALYQADIATSTLGTSSVLYIANVAWLATSTATSTPGAAGWGFATADFTSQASSTSRVVNGSGWLPVAFSNISSGAPFSSLPIDPVGTGVNTSCGNTGGECTYTFLSNSTGQYKIAVKMESTKFNYGGAGDVVSGDGGNSTSTLEAGTNVTL